MNTTDKILHEEKVINGVLCWRATEGGEWTKYTAESLTIAFIAEKNLRRAFEESALKSLSALSQVRNIISREK